MKNQFEKRWQNMSGHRRGIVVEVHDDGDVCVTVEDSSMYPNEMHAYINPTEVPELIEVLKSVLEKSEAK